TARFNLLPAEYPDSTMVPEFQERLLARVAALPGVEAAGLSSSLPLQGATRTYFSIEGDPPLPDAQRPLAVFRTISPGLLDALRIPLVVGRKFTADDRPGSLPVML